MRILPPILKQSKDLMEVFISLLYGFYVELYKILQNSAFEVARE